MLSGGLLAVLAIIVARAAWASTTPGGGPATTRPWSAGGARRAAAVSRPSAIVIGLDTVAGLETCRILARRGVRVVGIAADERHPGCRTNTCSRVVIAPVEGEPLLEALESLRKTEAGAVLFPCTDASVRTLAHACGRLSGFRAVLPAAEVVDILSDERRFAELARVHDLPIPARRVVTDVETALHAARDLRFPCVARPIESTTAPEVYGPVVRCFDDESKWFESAGSLLELHPRLVLQEKPVGRGDEERYFCSCYVSPHGLPILTFVTRSLRRWPPRLGASCLEESVNDARVRHLTLDVVSCVPFAGIATVESERDPTTDADRIVGVTVGRPDFRSGVAEAGGVELLYTMYQDAVGAPLPPHRRQQDRPVKWMHPVNDVRSALHALRGHQLTPAGWYGSLRGWRMYAGLDAYDPIPSAAAITRRLRAQEGQRRAIPPTIGNDG